MQNSSANKCFLKVAHFAAQIEKYSRAIEIFEQVIDFSKELYDKIVKFLKISSVNFVIVLVINFFLRPVIKKLFLKRKGFIISILI